MLKLLLRVQTPIQHTLIDTLIKTAHALVRTGIFCARWTRGEHAEKRRGYIAKCCLLCDERGRVVGEITRNFVYVP